jgi:hypothetical protein
MHGTVGNTEADKKTRAGVGLVLVGFALAITGLGCSSSSSADVAYETTYAADYYYPSDLAYSGVYGAGWGFYYAPSTGDGIAYAGAGGNGVGGTGGAATSGMRGAVAEAIRILARGGTVCGDQATVTRQGSSVACDLDAPGVKIVFTACQLAAGGTVDGTVDVQFDLTASNSACDSSTTVSASYTSTISDLTYTATDGEKVVIPSQTDMAAFEFPVGQTPTKLTITSSGEIRRIAADGTMTSDRTYTGARKFSSISIPDLTYTVDGAVNLTDSGGATGTVMAGGLTYEPSCCLPLGGTLTVSRSGGSHAGSHTWDFSAVCDAATLDGKTVTLAACN